MTKTTSTLKLIFGALGKLLLGVNEILRNSFSYRVFFFALAASLTAFILYGPYSAMNIVYYLKYTAVSLILAIVYNRVISISYTILFILACAIDNYRERQENS